MPTFSLFGIPDTTTPGSNGSDITVAAIKLLPVSPLLLCVSGISGSSNTPTRLMRRAAF